MNPKSHPKKTFLLLTLAVCLVPAAAVPQVSRPLIPYHAVPKREDRTRLQNLADEYTLYRELRPAFIEGTGEQYDFLLDHLDLTTLIVRKLGLGKQVLHKVAPGTLEGDDGEGLTGRITLVHHERGKRIYVARGRLRGFLFMDVRGRAAIVAQQIPQSARRQGLHLTVFVKLDNRFLDVMTHLFSPMLSGAVMGRISKFLTATRVASRAIRDNPGRILYILQEAEDLDKTVKGRFSLLFLRRQGGGPSPPSPSRQPPPPPHRQTAPERVSK
jgi:hypothetical protein